MRIGLRILLGYFVIVAIAALLLGRVFVQEVKPGVRQAMEDTLGVSNDEGKATLRNTQRSWIEERNAECSRREGDSFFVNISCASDMTIRRSQFLQDRYRECVATGCQNSKLGG